MVLLRRERGLNQLSPQVLSVVVKEWGVLTKEVRATPTQIKKAGFEVDICS